MLRWLLAADLVRDSGTFAKIVHYTLVVGLSVLGIIQSAYDAVAHNGLFLLAIPPLALLPRMNAKARQLIGRIGPGEA